MPKADIFEPEPNTLYTLALKYSAGKPCNSPISGPKVLYSLGNGLAFFAPPEADAAIRAAGIKVREPFRLCKAQTGPKEFKWEVEKLEAPGESVPEPPATYQSKDAPITQKHTPKPMGNATRAITPAKPDVVIPPTLTTAESRRIFLQLVATIQAAQAAEQFAESINFPVKFGPDDLRAMAISGFIEQSRTGRAA